MGAIPMFLSCFWARCLSFFQLVISLAMIGNPALGTILG